MFLDWLEHRIDPFAPFDEVRTPPKTVSGFAWFYLRPIRAALLALFVIAVIAGSVEASLYLVMRWFIDLLGSADRETVLRDHAFGLGLAFALVALVRPVAIWAHEVLSNQLVVPQSTNQIRWRTHLYTLGHSLSYFPGRLRRAARQPGGPGRPGGARTRRGVHRHAALRGDLCGDRDRPVRLDLALAGVAGRGLDRGLCGPHDLVRAARSCPLSQDCRLALGADRPCGRQLHQHPHRQAVRPRPRGACGGARCRRHQHARLPAPVPAREPDDQPARPHEQRAAGRHCGGLHRPVARAAA